MANDKLGIVHILFGVDFVTGLRGIFGSGLGLDLLDGGISLTVCTLDAGHDYEVEKKPKEAGEKCREENGKYGFFFLGVHIGLF